MGDHAYGVTGVVDARHQVIEPAQVVVDRFRVETCLRTIERRGDVSGEVAGNQQAQSDAGLGRGIEHRMVKRVTMGVTRPGVTHVVKFAHAGETVADHLPEACGAQRTTPVGIEGVDQFIHRLPPAPEGAGILGEGLRDPAKPELERMGMGVDETGQQGTGKTFRVTGKIHTDRGDAALRIDSDPHASAEGGAVPDHGWFNQALHRGDGSIPG